MFGEALPSSVDDRMVSLMRLILALSALLIIFIDPSEPDRFVTLTYVSLVLYSIYSAALHLSALRGRTLIPSRHLPWIDVAMYLVLVSLSSGTSSIFFFFFFFPTLVSSFRYGFRAGLRVALSSAALFTAVGFATAPGGAAFEVNRFLLRPIYLTALGYMIAYWGGSEVGLRARLSLLREVNELSNPRFGVGHTIESMMKRVRDFYGAEKCLLLLTEPRTGKLRLRRVTDEDPQAAASEEIPPEAAGLLNALPEDLAVAYNRKPSPRFLRGAGYVAFDVATGARTERGLRESEQLAECVLEADSFVSVPLSHRGAKYGRVFLAGRAGGFDARDIEFISQIVAHAVPVINNIRLLDQLASNAAERERQKIARDLHDTVIQPYLGVQYKVAAIRKKMSANGSDVSEDIERLYQMVSGEITGLRGVVDGLRTGVAHKDDLLSALQAYARQFADHYSIAVEVECAGEIRINDRLAAEVLQIAFEGLSNIRRHTDSARGSIRIGVEGRTLRMRIENDGVAGRGGDGGAFTPRSISGRAEDLGGRTRVECTREGKTAVVVEIPL